MRELCFLNGPEMSSGSLSEQSFRGKYTMQKKTALYLLLSLLCCWAKPVIAQSFQEQVDSLHVLYAQTSDTKGRVDILNEIGYAFRRLSPDSVMHYADRALALARPIHYAAGLAYAYKVKGIGHYKYGSPTDTTIYYYEKAIAYAQEANDFYTQAACYNNIALINIHELAYQEAVKNLLKGVAIFDDHIASESRLKALMIANLGTAYHRQEDHKRGIAYYEEALAMAERINNISVPSIYLDELARAKMAEGRLAEAVEDINRLLPLHDELGDIESKMETLMTLGEIEMERGNFAEARSHIQDALAIAKEREFARKEAQGYLHLAASYQREGRWREAVYHANLSRNAAEKITAFSIETQAVQMLSDAYATGKDYQMAHLYAVAYHEMIVEDLNSDRRELADELEAKYQNQKRLDEIDRLNAEKEAQQQRFQSLAFLTVLFMGTLVFLIYQMVQKNKTTAELNEKNEALRRAEQKLSEKNLELERYIESNLQLENFAHLASHDLREPMRNIVSFSQLLGRSAKDKLSPTEIDYLTFIQKGVRRIESLVKDLLAYSIINHTPLEIEAVDLELELHHVLQDIQPLVKESSADIQLDNMPRNIIADRSRLFQLFQNLLTNAIAYRQENVPPKILVQCTEEDTHYRFKVQDNGVGIDPRFQDQIFVLFKTLENKSVTGSSGIGLATCRKVVEDHQGKIWVESQVGEGSTFYFTLSKHLSA